LYFLRSDRGAGTGTGLKMSQGRTVNAAKNYSAAVISMQTENYPGGLHTTIDVFDGDPDTDCGSEAMAWFSTYRAARTT
jgi:DNA (cytosine-5)-methyltransferase 1